MIRFVLDPHCFFFSDDATWHDIYTNAETIIPRYITSIDKGAKKKKKISSCFALFFENIITNDTDKGHSRFDDEIFLSIGHFSHGILIAYMFYKGFFFFLFEQLFLSLVRFDTCVCFDLCARRVRERKK